jgi:hypothetical protein
MQNARPKTEPVIKQSADQLQAGVKCVSQILLDANISLDESESLREMFLQNCKLEIVLKHALN